MQFIHALFFAVDSVSFSKNEFYANESDMTLDVVLMLERSTFTQRRVGVAIRTKDLTGEDSAEGKISVCFVPVVYSCLAVVKVFI